MMLTMIGILYGPNVDFAVVASDAAGSAEEVVLLAIEVIVARL